MAQPLTEAGRNQEFLERMLKVLFVALILALILLPHFVNAQDIPPDDEPFLYKNKPLHLIQPLDDTTTELLPEPGIGIFFTYFNLSWPWVIGVAAGIAVLQALYGGILIMISGGKEQKEAGKEKLMWALAGLLMVGLSGMILETLNPIFFQQV